MSLHSRQLRVADVVARRLALESRVAFGVPGGEVLTVIDALRAAGVEFVLARHESSAGFMAEGYQRVRGGVGVLVATLGPGVANTINYVAHAQQSRRPVIVLTGSVVASDVGTYTHQVFDHQQVLRPLTKASFHVSPGAACDVIDRAITVATTGVPGPVHIEVPVDVADVLIESREHHPTKPARAAVDVDDPALVEARSALQKAERPLCLIGLEMLTSREPELLSDLISAHGIPCVTTYEAKGVVDEHHLLCIGAAGLSPKADRDLLPLVKRADVVLLAGYDPVEMRQSWRHPFAQDAIVIEATRRGGTHGMHTPTYQLGGEPGVVLRQLFLGLERERPSWTAGEPEAVRRRLRESFAPAGAWGPDAIFDVMENALGRDTIVTADTGSHRILLCQQWRFRRPGLLMQSNGLSTMACALPMAMGAKMANFEAPVVCVVGDGGLEMGMGELGTLRDLRLPLTVVVIDDRSLSLIEKKQRERGLACAGVNFGGATEDFRGTDYVGIARAFGGEGVRVEEVTRLERELVAAQQRDVFTLIHCPIARQAYDGKI